jgi:hypothetical protein
MVALICSFFVRKIPETNSPDAASTKKSDATSTFFARSTQIQFRSLHVRQLIADRFSAQQTEINSAGIPTLSTTRNVSCRVNGVIFVCPSLSLFCGVIDLSGCTPSIFILSRRSLCSNTLFDLKCN